MVERQRTMERGDPPVIVSHCGDLLTVEGLRVPRDREHGANGRPQVKQMCLVMRPHRASVIGLLRVRFDKRVNRRNAMVPRGHEVTCIGQLKD